MHRLTREVRFAINGENDEQLSQKPTNGYGGFPSVTGYGPFMSIEVTMSGAIDPVSSYLINIKQIDAVVRERAVPVVAEAVLAKREPPARLVGRLYEMLKAWPPLTLERLSLNLSPFLSYSTQVSERPMIRLSQKFEFSATHRLHNPKASEAENGRIFGKCNNPHGHGHNYEVQVTLKGEPDENGVLIAIPEFENTVGRSVIDRFDHKNLNVELSEFAELIPTVENIAMVIYLMLKPKFNSNHAALASVTVWETPKTWCEYSE
jgi:6-pyruvoyltetrahydropterin/6-carboxytetrahydropterin synthase